MRVYKITIGFLVYFMTSFASNAQELTQVVRGKVVDAETQVPIAYATIAVVTTEPVTGTVSDIEGNFRIKQIPVGRHNIHVSFVGYETVIIPELMVSSGKETVLTIKMREKISEMEEVVVKAFTKKDKPINNMSTLSARTFSVEEAQRYAGGLDDPSRLASSFAGITTGDLNDNGIVIRGNAPKGLLWRLEGIEISNPNHFAGFIAAGGGSICAISSLMLSNSDFFTGAFPAEYGNAMSGVFDLKLRTGNNENYEHTFQVGTLGIDISSEGPLKKNSGSSYLFNYRYSTFALVQYVLPDYEVPIYQDFNIKINVPTKKAGVFSFWGLASDDKLDFKVDDDTSTWRNAEDQELMNTIFRIGAAGLNHKYIMGKKTYLHSSVAITGDYIGWDNSYVDYNLSRYKMYQINNTNYKLTITSVLNHKFNAKHTNRTGFIINNLNDDLCLKFAPETGDELQSVVDKDISSMNYNIFSQSRINLNKNFTLNLGFHSQYLDFNKELIFEPRMGLTYNISNKQSVSVAYGKHSRLEPLYIYFSEIMEDNTAAYPNKDLKTTKAHHLALSYDISFNPDLRLKIEPYYQYLFDVPVIPDSSYSTINLETDWFFTEKLSNKGSGTNYGIDITLERFLNNGYYYLFTTSLFESKYKGGDNIERNTRYNSHFVFNLLFGKEWVLGANKNKILSVSGRLNVYGGRWEAPVITDYPYQKGDKVLYDYSQPFSVQAPYVYRVNTTVNYRINKTKHANIWSVQILNLLGREEHYGYLYDYKKREIVEEKLRIIFPSISYKIEF